MRIRRDESHAAALPRRAAQRGRDRLLQPLVRIGCNEAHATEAALDQAAEKRRPKGSILRWPDINAEHLALALAGDADRDHGRLAGHTSVDPHLVIRGVHPEVRIVRGQGPRAERLDQGIELGADPRHFRFRYPVEAQGLHQLVNLSGRHTVHVRFLDNGQQRMLGAPAWLQ